MFISYKSQHPCRLQLNSKIIQGSKTHSLSNISPTIRVSLKIHFFSISPILRKINSFIPPATPSPLIYSAPPSKMKKLSSLSTVLQDQKESYVSLKVLTKGTSHGAKKHKITLSFFSLIFKAVMEACIRKKLSHHLMSKEQSISPWPLMEIKFQTLNS